MQYGNKILFLIFFVLFSCSLFAQTDSTEKKEKFRKWNFGIEAGTNLSPKVYSNTERMIKNNPQLGFTANTMINYNINKHWAISTGLGLYTLKFKFEEMGTNSDSVINVSGTYKGEYKFTYFNLPLSLQYNIMENEKIYYVAKCGVRYDLMTSRRENLFFVNDSLNIEQVNRKYRADRNNFSSSDSFYRYRSRYGVISPFFYCAINYRISDKIKILLGINYTLLLRNPELLLISNNGNNINSNHTGANLWALNTGIIF